MKPSRTKIWMQSDYEKAVNECKTLDELLGVGAGIGNVVIENFFTSTKEKTLFYHVQTIGKTFTYIAIGDILFTKDFRPTCYRLPFPQSPISLESNH